MEKRMLITQPPFRRLFKRTFSVNRYPLAFGYLAGTIKKETDWNVMVYNADFYPNSEFAKLSYLTGIGFNEYLRNLEDLSGEVWQEVRSTILDYKPSVVGVTAFSLSFRTAKIVAKIVKDVNKDIVVIVGGPHASIVGPEVLNCPDIDIVVKGEGEVTIVELLNAIERKKELNLIKGICYRKKNNIIDNPPRELIDNLDSLCFPQESAEEVLKDYEKYPLSAFMNIFATRGCPYNCYFCSSRKIWTRKVRFRSVENVIKEIKLLQKRGLRRIRFDDDMFGVNKPHIKDLCKALIKHCPGLKWECEIHLSLIDDTTLSLMKSAGCVMIQVGIESGSNEILKIMRKRYTIEKALATCILIKKYGFKLEAFFMVGFPHETEETINETYEAIKKAKVDKICYNIFTPFPGSEAYEFCKEKGLIDNSVDSSRFNYHSPENCFVVNLSHKKFRELVEKIEKMADKKNQFYRIRKLLDFDLFYRFKELGLRRSIQRGVRVLTGR